MAEEDPFAQRASMAIYAERARQTNELGYTAERDAREYTRERDDHLHRAACCYFNTATGIMPVFLEVDWPWNIQHWKPGTVERNLVKAGALWLARIDQVGRRDRVRQVLNVDAQSAGNALKRTVNILAMVYRDRAEQEAEASQ